MGYEYGNLTLVVGHISFLLTKAGLIWTPSNFITKRMLIVCMKTEECVQCFGKLKT